MADLPPCVTFTASTLTSAQYQESDAYNTEGQLTTGPEGGYTYGDSKHLHAVTATSNGYTASYDSAGTMVCRALTSATTCNGTQTGQQLGYDPEGRLSTWQDKPGSPSATANYLYDGEGNRVATQTTSAGNTTTTAYIGNSEEVQSIICSSAQVTTYYYIGGVRLGANVGGTFYYFGYDILGSQVLVLNSSGSVAGEQLFGPYGNKRYTCGILNEWFGEFNMEPPSSNAFLQLLRTEKQNVSSVVNFIHATIASGHSTSLYDLAAVLEAHIGDQAIDSDILEVAIERIYRAQPLTHNLPMAVIFLKISHQLSKYRPSMTLAKSAYQASCLAGWQPEEVLVELVEYHFSEECYFDFFGYLLYEMVLRGVQVEKIPGLQQFQEKMGKQQHSLAWLPLSLTDIEQKIDFIYHKVLNLPESLFDPILLEDSATPDIQESDMEEVTTDKERDCLQTAVSGWLEQSNGCFEARVFATSHPLALIKLSPHLLFSLHLDCLKGVEKENSLITLSSLQQIVLDLYIASSNGGAYSRGRGGALGRLEAWRSLAALVGAKEEAPFEQVVEHAKHSAWFTFEVSATESQWFKHVAWDIGIIALRPNRCTMALLAATDTD